MEHAKTAAEHHARAAFHHDIGGKHIFAGKQRHADGERLPHRRKTGDRGMHLPNEAEFQIALDHDDGVEILPIITRRSGGRLLFEHKEYLRFGRAVRFHSAERPSRRVDLHLPRFE